MYITNILISSLVTDALNIAVLLLLLYVVYKLNKRLSRVEKTKILKDFLKNVK